MDATLTAEEEARVLRVIKSLESDAGARKQSGRRHERQPFRRRLVINLLSQRDLPEISIVTRDISVGGIGFLSRRPFGADEHFALHLPTAQGKDKLALCQARHCRYAAGGLYIVGALFCEIADAIDGVPRHWVMLAAQRPTV